MWSFNYERYMTHDSTCFDRLKESTVFLIRFINDNTFFNTVYKKSCLKTLLRYLTMD